MAGVLQKAERKAKSVDSINQSAAALVEHFKLDIEPLAASKYPEYAELDRLDYAAAVMSAVLEKTKPEEKPPKPPAQAQEESKRSLREIEVRPRAYVETVEPPTTVEATNKTTNDQKRHS